MVELLDTDIRTKEVLQWEGLHLFHYSGSSCSQKLRIYLRLKGIEWTSHHINLAKKEQTSEWFMGINPRGLVPVLVHDGKVIIESNDILEYLETRFPEPELIPRDQASHVSEMLKFEDDLHLDLRALSMRYQFPSFLTKRPQSELEKYRSRGSGTVAGEIDPHREVELKFWSDMNEQGITNDQARRAARKFHAQFVVFDDVLSRQTHLLGEKPSLIDIAWYIYARRLVDASYPLRRLHPRVSEWFDRLDRNPAYRDEVPAPVPLRILQMVHHSVQAMSGSSLSTVAGL